MASKSVIAGKQSYGRRDGKQSITVRDETSGYPPRATNGQFNATIGTNGKEHGKSQQQQQQQWWKQDIAIFVGPIFLGSASSIVGKDCRGR